MLVQGLVKGKPGPLLAALSIWTVTLAGCRVGRDVAPTGNVTAAPLAGRQARDAPPATVAHQQAYAFRQDLRPEYTIVYHGTLTWGHLDAAGNFVPIPGEIRAADSGNVTASRHIRLLKLARKPHEAVYEFRSGRLVPGSLEDDCRFVPAVDAKVISIEQYRYGEDDRRIYNLPGRFVESRE